ncbi:MAG TPA: hypothetical protein PKK63_03925 [Bacillota bacterium]|nr:MAG: hypothetical protein BWY00_00149 [Firmicutes bacterium ADurb.Bin153]HNV34662.1 hypothetical protein [Bacillota bacterium]
MMAKRMGRAAQKVLDAAFPEPHRCLHCKKELTKQAPGLRLCHACSSVLAAAVVFERRPSDGRTGPGSIDTKGPVYTSVRLDPGAAGLIEGLLVQGKLGLAALSKAIAHAIPLAEYLGVDSVYLAQATSENCRDFSPYALGRALAGAFGCRYMGNVPSADGSWQDTSISRYSGRSKGKKRVSSYPVLIHPAGGGHEAALDKLTARGAIKVMTVEIWRYHDEQQGV